MRRALLTAALLLASCAPVETPTRAPGTDAALPPMQGFAGAPARAPLRSNAEISRDFLDLAFRMESGRSVPTLTRFEEPITVRVTGRAPASLSTDLSALLGRLRREAGIEIGPAPSGGAASITVEAVPSATLRRAVPRAACFVVPRVSSWAEFSAARRSPQVDWTTLTRRDRAAIFVPSDAAPQEIRDCLHEELAQALGPLNDLYRLPDSVFNDDNIHAVLTGFDMLVLRTYYAPELRNGMSRAQVQARLPAVLARLNPAGEAGGRGAGGGVSQDWVQAMQTALSSDATPGTRRAAASRAVDMARAFGWTGAREGFAHYAYGRLMVGHDGNAAHAAFTASARAYSGSSLTRIHAAHVAVQLAAFELRGGNGQAVLDLVEPAIPVARAHENAALLATLMMFRAEGLELTGQFDAARETRLDSLRWARYGFGSDAEVRARQREIAALRPASAL
ncbi:DUF2927 domain-containing protein [Histidinibacterium aquaticum]|uniref:DUF2927 domain-containing protein n=1 Tax=Histidinibacterium aquaticum TaxID=2613962 RepID=A0A5J5GKT4_9RHOB|nr:DUF2927 domain-containing protein [Histidinibacterium aquaticum]KAA9008909.1 DUF2927 domain-containing protein [Histidinibacterium aquaticum]